MQTLRDALRERGYLVGRDVAIDARYANGKADELPRLASELVNLAPTILIALGSNAATAVHEVAPRLPIVALVGDFRSAGLASDFGRPGGSTTGVSFLSSELDAKRLEFLASVLPKKSTVMLLGDRLSISSGNPGLIDVGQALGLTLRAVNVSTPEEVSAAYASARRSGINGVNVLSSPFLNGMVGRIIELAASTRLPSIYHWPESAERGGLMAYGPRLSLIYRQLAGFVSRILEGALPSQLPIEQPTIFEFVINLRTASSLRLTIPQTTLVQATTLIRP
jgi:putative ABC transport system substrate-binding protein